MFLISSGPSGGDAVASLLLLPRYQIDWFRLFCKNTPAVSRNWFTVHVLSELLLKKLWSTFSVSCRLISENIKGVFAKLLVPIISERNPRIGKVMR